MDVGIQGMGFMNRGYGQAWEQGRTETGRKVERNLPPFLKTSINSRQTQLATTEGPVTTTCFGSYQAILRLYTIIYRIFFDKGHPVVFILTNSILYFSSDTTHL